MNISYTFIVFAFILLFSNSVLAYRIYPFDNEPYYQENVPAPRIMMVISADNDGTRPQYVSPSIYQAIVRKSFFLKLSIIRLCLLLIYSFNFRTCPTWLGW